MNRILATGLFLGATLLSGAAHAQANAMLLAQANDRCMTTYAVRMTKTDATDDAIFAAATEGCKELKAQLFGAIDKEYPADQASGLKSQLDAAEKPNFMKLLQKIRTDRLQRGAN
ncbi:hypothetical protein SAMN05428974_3628 [Sphingopyxis sp. YR583]|uniref:hypothetical protein n=1 Tax=Sphingopyxis sp. YR583 TaxID=1881047 RepID=UPI0008A7F2A5|nr:hypothetical protein [Sphingopyxis sp. YR583]SEH19748.1 hypothetical protein SAMN05428974_3628 [Sphingopyxis sp. YR583]